MNQETWRDRLKQAKLKSGRSARSISLASELGPGYWHSIMSEGKEPTIDNIVALCKTLNVSLTWVLMGVEMSRETERIIQALENDEERRDALLGLLDKADKKLAQS